MTKRLVRIGAAVVHGLRQTTILLNLRHFGRRQPLGLFLDHGLFLKPFLHASSPFSVEKELIPNAIEPISMSDSIIASFMNL